MELGDLPDKEDTGYYSSLAMELEGDFSATIELDLSEMSEEERLAELQKYQDSSYKVDNLVDTQIKLAKNQLNAERLHLNLTSGDASVDAMTLDGDILRIQYVVTTETLVSLEELREEGIDPNSLINKLYEVKVASDPQNMFERFGEACASGFDDGSLAGHNYFYYFDPDKEGCEVALAPDAKFVAKSLLPQEDKFPEYDKLTADGVVDIVIFFGAAGHEDTVPWGDWGMREWRDMNSSLRELGFDDDVGVLDVGVRWTRERSGVKAIIDVISPEDLHALNDDSDGLFAQQLRTKEIVIYDGHSFYGSLDVLDEKANYPEDKYQILFMNSCWSYEYYTKQVFRHKATEADPKGWANVDIVNDTESGWFHNMEDMTRILLTNLLAGAESGGVDSQGRQFSWQNIIGVMNDEAIRSQEVRNSKSHEIYGVSGVTDNKYKP
jgi:hypothetical protein